jgi:uncharacterized protein (DUF3820 family)
VHKVKTLLDVPESYIPYLELQGNIDHMAGLKEAIALFKQGKPPIDVVRIQQSLADVLSTQPVSSLPSPSTAPARPVTSPIVSVPSDRRRPIHPPASQDRLLAQPGPSSQDVSSQLNPPSEPADYKFNFGKWSGKGILEVPYDYLKFLKDQNVAEGKPGLAAAIAHYERVKQPEKSYRLTFGKNKGRSLFEVDADYIQFLKGQGVVKSYPDLAAAMDYFDVAAATTRRPAKKKKRKRTTYCADPVDEPYKRKGRYGAYCR